MKPYAFKGKGAASELYWVHPDHPPAQGLTVLIQYRGKRKFVTYHQAWHDGEQWHFHDSSRLRRSKYITMWANIHRGEIVENRR